ncbi:MAG: hypothetical protein HN904_01600, partial [Victivallales bacterium]|nr:hypothetical protein [Victivallales bacterium]
MQFRRRGRPNEFISVPVDAAWIVANTLEAAGISFEAQADLRKVESGLPRTPDEVRTRLLASELREGIWDDWLLDFQKRGITQQAMAGGGHLWWKPGCLTGDSEIIINRAGKATRVRLDHLVHKFNGGGSGGQKWNLDIPTRTGALWKTGNALLLNEIVAAVACGPKEVWCVKTAHGESLKASADHVFILANGKEKKLSELQVGDVLLRRQASEERERKPRTRKHYPEVRHMWNHPHGALRVFQRADRPGSQRKKTVPLHRLVAEARLNGLDLDTLVGRIVLGRTDGLQFLDPLKWHVHHRDHNPRNNAPENLEVLEIPVHLRQHGRNSHFQHVVDAASPTAIMSITAAGVEETYDLTLVSPQNTFVANGIVVHNSGKTAGAIAWGLTRQFDPRTSKGAILTVTKAAVRHRWGREIEKLSHVRPWVSDPDDRRRSGWRSLDDYLIECWAYGRRPWVVVGWEELAALVFGADAHQVAGTLADVSQEKLVGRIVTPEQALFCAVGQVQGVGPSLAEVLVSQFGTIEALQGAAPDAIHALPGVGQRTLASLLAARHYLVPQAPIAQVHQALQTYNFDTVIFDEIHAAKNRQRKRWIVGEDGQITGHNRRNMVDAAEWISRKAKLRLGTTATPIPNRMRDLWGILDLVQPWGMGGYWKWAKRYCLDPAAPILLPDGTERPIEELRVGDEVV